MGLLSLDDLVFTTSKSNLTSPDFSALPSNLLETLIPGYGPISQFVSEYLGFDVTIVVSLCLLIFATTTAFQYLWRYTSEAFSTWMMAKVTVSSEDDIFDHLMQWIATQGISKDSRSLIAATQVQRTWDAVTGDIEEKAPGMDVEDIETDQWLNHFDSDSKMPPRFEPDFGEHYFRHGGRFFFLSRTHKSAFSSSWVGGAVLSDKETVTLTCLGRSTEPIKQLLKEVTQSHTEKESAMTRIRRPAPKEERASRYTPWVKVATRPSRPLKTVVLNYDQKKSLLKDINEYLHRDTPRWYSNRGIPYRRGYLFHGPPGTGKTSLSFAIAGCFGLDVYVVSLLDSTISEDDLMLLFNNLPRRCVVLLEDIDASGITHKREPVTPPEGDGVPGKDWSLVDVAKAMKASKDDDDKDKKKGISLSGLLNAIDGVASHEGRVLVMTTNHPEKLDDALIRPGRVDLQVGFTLATKAQIFELFVSMYSSEQPKPMIPAFIKSVGDLIGPEVDSAEWTKETDPPETSPVKSSKSNGEAQITKQQRKNALESCSLSQGELRAVARKFASLLPDCKFSPAEIQGFLLTRKTDPHKALDEVERWRDSLLENKATRSKVLAVQ
ncbi:MAG: hypothetical protein M1814_001390 [Vezdaea aestivalis]|nr:MAG: hypothetical protein M1814_001390 [Vezdaea aestivalis]